MKQSHPSVLAALCCLCLAALSRTPLREFIWWCFGKRPKYLTAPEPVSLAVNVDDLRRTGL